MKVVSKICLFIAIVALFGCTTIEIRPDGSVFTKGPRQTIVITRDVSISTGKMLMDDQTILALGKEAKND